MSLVDWIVLCGTLAGIVGYGAWRSREVLDMDTYMRGGNTLKWPTIGLSIMATQASAITFLSTPGQAYEDGMRFIQFYFGLPLAMIVISAVFVPAYFRLKVYTAYEYLEHRFDVRVRTLGALLFLVQRGLAAGITIYAPSIILSSILGWPLEPMILIMGALVVIYTVSGGSKTVAITQKHQMVVMLGGLAVAAVVVVWRLPGDVSLGDAVRLAGASGRMNAVNFDLDFSNRYNFWSGLTGGFFLAMSYFGTDQSQVQRYLSGRNIAESRLGLIFNGIFKIPMQFAILFVGVMVFVFYLFVRPPLFFNAPTLARVAESSHAAELVELEGRFDRVIADRRAAAVDVVRADSPAARQRLVDAGAGVTALRGEARALIKRALPKAETRDSDYVFISFVLGFMPVGLVGLLIAVIFCAAMSSISSELTALGSTTMLDLYRRFRPPRTADPARDLRESKLFTILWGGIAVAFATFASLLDNLIQAVNILGSIFYGTVLGLFVVAFFLKWVTATPVLLAALAAQATVIALFFASDIGFLWYNVIGCGVVVVVAMMLQPLVGSAPKPQVTG